MDKKIIIYGTEACGLCNQAKAFFKLYHIPFEFLDVGKDKEKREEMLKFVDNLQLPVITIGGKLLCQGYNRAELIVKLDI